MPEPLPFPSLATKGFDARQAIDALLADFAGVAEALARLDEAIAIEKRAFAMGGRTRDCVALFNQNVALLQQQKDAYLAATRRGVLASLRRGSLFAFGYVPPVASRQFSSRTP